MHISMTALEIKMLRRYLESASVYLEFGIGGSTIEAARQGVPVVFGVESDPNWIRTVRDSIDQGGFSRTRLVIHHADIGVTREWGMPLTENPLPSWIGYYLDIWGGALMGQVPDLVLIDGRFRTACAVLSLIACPQSTNVLMHDFFDSLTGRQNYHRVLEIADIEDRCENLVLLRRKSGDQSLKALAILSQTRFDYF